MIRIRLWMIAAILISGAGVFTACTSDKGNLSENYEYHAASLANQTGFTEENLPAGVTIEEMI